MGRVAAIGPAGLLHADLLRQKNSALRMPQTTTLAKTPRHAFRLLPPATKKPTLRLRLAAPPRGAFCLGTARRQKSPHSRRNGWHERLFMKNGSREARNSQPPRGHQAKCAFRSSKPPISVPLIKTCGAVPLPDTAPITRPRTLFSKGISMAL